MSTTENDPVKTDNHHLIIEVIKVIKILHKSRSKPDPYVNVFFQGG